jgi:hypothetical protein
MVETGTEVGRRPLSSGSPNLWKRALSPWTGSRRLRPPVRPASDGRYRIAPLPAGVYVAALTDLDPEDLYDPAFLEQVAASSLTVTLAEGEKRVQDLRLARS